MSENEIKVIDKRMPVPSEEPIESTTNVAIVAMQKGYQPEFIEKMLELQERHEKNEARKAYYDAVAGFKAEAPEVTKDKVNQNFNSRYTSLGNLLQTYSPILGKFGLSISFPTPQQSDKSMTVECRLSHKMGHYESISMTAPIDEAAIGKQSGQRSRNKIQDIKSTFTYLRAATCEAILGVAGTEGTVDDDGNSAGKKYITDEQIEELKKLVKKAKPNMTKFHAFIGTSEYSKITADIFTKAKSMLNDKIKHQSKDRQPGEDDDK